MKLESLVPEIAQLELMTHSVDLENHMWKDKHKKLHPVREMPTDYIKNCIRAFKNGIIPYGWHGGWIKWKAIFEAELRNRQ